MAKRRRYRLMAIIVAGLWLATASASAAVGEEPERDVLFVLDNSGSMSKNDPDFIIRSVVQTFVRNMAPGSRLGMVVFDREARLAVPLAALGESDTLEGFMAALARIDYRGQFTNTPAAVERAIYELRSNGRPSAAKSIILLTDGIVDTGDPVQDLESERWLKETLAGESRKLGIKIFGIAFTDKADFRLLQTLAQETNGAYFRAYRVEDIESVLDEISAALAPPPSPPVETPAASAPPAPVAPATTTVPPPAAPPTPQNVYLLPLVVSAVVFALGVFTVLILIFSRKRQARAWRSGGGRRSETVDTAEPERQAELIDVENIIANDTKSLLLNKRSIKIGRDAGNDIVIAKKSVSSEHATIEYRRGQFYLEDLRSTNGTRLNDRKVASNRRVRLKSGDKITFAVYEFRFLLPDLAPFGETVMIQESDREKLQQSANNAAR